MFFIEEDQRIRGTAVSVSNSVFEGPMHPVGRDQLFFSTTDATGIITQVNSVFIELVRYPRERLIGAPHNINRHPGMPGAAFLAMWATLRQGLPFCAYVHNAASDGSRYTVFATITPLGDGYLSVRGPVCVPAYLDAATALYEAVRPVELQARDGGASAHQAAEIGLAKLVPLLNEAGFATYNDFVLATLPAEVLARDAAGATFPERPGATGELARLLTASAGVHAELQSWLARLDQLQRAADSLAAARERLEATIEAWRSTANEFGSASDGSFHPIMLSIDVWREMSAEIGRVLTDFLPPLTELRTRCAQSRFRIALARLHNDAIGQFVTELIDGAPGADEARPAVLDLARALTDGVRQTMLTVTATGNLAAAVAKASTEMVELVTFPIPLLESWESMAAESGDPAAIELMPSVREVVESGVADAELLVGLADDVRAVAGPLDASSLRAAVEDLAVRARWLSAGWI